MSGTSFFISFQIILKFIFMTIIFLIIVTIFPNYGRLLVLEFPTHGAPVDYQIF